IPPPNRIVAARLGGSEDYSEKETFYDKHSTSEPNSLLLRRKTIRRSIMPFFGCMNKKKPPKLSGF
ncbi:MAG: hypothetical protein EBX50_22175, partial [Chitinophagia bacterium]|nr:hypothetical protein [Chitinophagia bacterium]